jgi:hypothetical protein
MKKRPLKFTIIINQYGIAEQGLLNKTDMIDWAIMNFLVDMFLAEKAHRIIVQNKEFVWINYNYILECLPILHLNNKHSLIRRFKKLRALGLLFTYKALDNTLYYRPTPYATSIYVNQITAQKKHQKSLPGNAGVTSPGHSSVTTPDTSIVTSTILPKSNNKINNTKHISPVKYKHGLIRIGASVNKLINSIPKQATG